MRRSPLALFLLVAATACSSTSYVAPTPVITPPANLTYKLEPSGDPAFPVGVILRWDPPADAAVAAYVVYSRPSAAGAWYRRATTTSASFSDLGVPDLQYMVASADGAGNESAGSNVITVDPANQLAAPPGLVGISLDRAVQLSWLPTARTNAPALFDYYRVYSTPYNAGTGLCTATAWAIEGTTVSEDFIASGLPNGVSRCFAVSAISVDGHESDWSSSWLDTPRPDARNVVIFAQQQDPTASGFIFYDPATLLLGVVTGGARADLDFRVERHVDGSLWLTPIRALTSVDPVGYMPDLTSIDLASTVSADYGTAAVPAALGSGYVFRTQLSDGLHYGAVRVTAITTGYVIVDWAFQTDPLNPELRRGRP